MNRFGKLLVGAALVAGITVGSAGVASASDPIIDVGPCRDGKGAGVYHNGGWTYVCVYP